MGDELDLDDLTGQPHDGALEGSGDTTSSDTDPSGSPDGDDQDGTTGEDEQKDWSPDRRKGYLDGTSKWKGQLDKTSAKAAELEAEREGLRGQIEFLQQQMNGLIAQPRGNANASPSLPDGITEETIKTRTDPLLQHSGVIQGLKQEIEGLKGILKETVAARPETLVDADQVPEDILKEITPDLRRYARANNITDPKVLRLVAKDMAAPKMAAELLRLRSADAKRRSERAAALKAAQPGASAAPGEAPPEDISNMTQEQLLGLFTGIDGQPG